MILLLWALGTPGALLLVALTSRPADRLWATFTCFALCAIAFLWPFAQKRFEGLAVLVSTTLAPAAVCMVGFFATGGTGHAWLAMLGLPMAWCAVFFDWRASLSAGVATTALVGLISMVDDGWPSGAVNAFEFGAAQLLVGWTAHRSARRWREAHRRSLEQHLPFPDLVLTETGEIVEANQAALETYGYTLDELRGSNVRRLGPAHDGDVAVETEHVRKDGTTFPVEVTSVRFEVSGQQFRHVMVRDVTARRASLRQMREAHEQLRALIENVPDTIARFDRDGRLLELHPGTADPFPPPPTRIGKPLEDITDPQIVSLVKEAIARALDTGERQQIEYSYQQPDGVHVYESRFWRANENEVAVVRRDVTALRALEERLHRGDRMAALGTLAAGVAHQINNPLTSLLGNMVFLREEFEATDDAELAAALRDAEEGASRVRDIVRDLQIFARPVDEHSATCAPRAVIEGCLRLLDNQLTARARVELALEDVPEVPMSASTLGQVVLQLASNALRAIPEADPTSHRVLVCARVVDDMVELEVEDDGRGIEKDALAHVFEPFYTTRALSGGTGLGLSMVHSAVTAIGGEITVTSEVGKGSRFVVRLPRATIDERVHTPLEQVRASATTRRILVIDDEEIVCRTVARQLQKMSASHEVVAVTDPHEALTRIERGERFDAVLCDLMMPGLSGMELYRAIVARDPAIASHVAFMTGGTFTEDAEKFLASVTNPRMNKPFDKAALASILEQI